MSRWRLLHRNLGGLLDRSCLLCEGVDQTLQHRNLQLITVLYARQGGLQRQLRVDIGAVTRLLENLRPPGQLRLEGYNLLVIELGELAEDGGVG